MSSKHYYDRARHEDHYVLDTDTDDTETARQFIQRLERERGVMGDRSATVRGSE